MKNMKINIDTKTLRRNLNLNYTYEEMERLLCESKCNIHRLLNDKTKRIDMALFIKLCYLADIEPMDLISVEYEDKENTESKNDKIINSLREKINSSYSSIEELSTDLSIHLAKNRLCTRLVGLNHKDNKLSLCIDKNLYLDVLIDKVDEKLKIEKIIFVKEEN